MKNVYFYRHTCPLFLILALITSCCGQSNPNVQKSNNAELDVFPKTNTQIDEYVVEVFEDKKGNLWFGTMSKGAARFDGKTLTYFSTKDGLCDNTVVSITEDREGNIWFGTHSGLSKYDGKTFTNFTSKEGLCNDRVSQILFDRAGNLWVGTWEGVCRFNGTAFSSFPLPVPDVEAPVYQATTNWVTSIIEDKQGNIWFGRSGYGACKYDGHTFALFTKKDGLPSNCVQAILEDKQGNIWFGTRVAERDHPDVDKRTGAGGLSRYDGKTFIQYPGYEGLSKNDIYSIHEDKKGNIWIGATGVGVYRYDGESFKIYKGTDRMDLTYGFGVQSILEDRNGTLWLGFSGGLFRLKGTSIINVTTNGPWQ
jgi:ligand-binding sensor domain-containing protein